MWSTTKISEGHFEVKGEISQQDLMMLVGSFNKLIYQTALASGCIMETIQQMHDLQEDAFMSAIKEEGENK